MSYLKKDDRRRGELFRQWSEEEPGSSSVWASDEPLAPTDTKPERGSVRASAQTPPAGRRKRRSEK